jgi:hypothetical protein
VILKNSFEQALANPEATGRLLVKELGAPFLAQGFSDSRALEDIRCSMNANLTSIRRAPPPPPTRHWSIVTAYAGIERAKLVIVNVRSGADPQCVRPKVQERAAHWPKKETPRTGLLPPPARCYRIGPIPAPQGVHTEEGSAGVGRRPLRPS